MNRVCKEMTKEDFLVLLNNDGYTIEEYITSTNIIAHDKNNYKYKICKSRYLSGKKPDWLQFNPYAMDNIRNYFIMNHPNVELVTNEYKNCKMQIAFVCKKHKSYGIQYRQLDNMIHLGRHCHYCALEKSSKITSIEKIKERCKELGLKYVDRVYNHDRNGILVKFECEKHKNKGIQTMSWDHFRNCASGCSYCVGKNKSTQDFILEIKGLNPDNEIIGEYTGLYNKIACRCKKCNNYWETTAASLKTGAGCPKCSSSHGERIISEILTKNGIKYETQKTFEGCLSVAKLKFDFYIPICNVVIEYDGQQHFFPVDFAGRGKEWAEQKFKDIQNRDKIKDDYCKRENIKLIRIPYNDYGKIDDYLAPVIQEYFLMQKQ